MSPSVRFAGSSSIGEMDRYRTGMARGHAKVFDVLARTTTWVADEREMYERTVDVPQAMRSIAGPRRRPTRCSTACAGVYRFGIPPISIGSAWPTIGTVRIASPGTVTRLRGACPRRSWRRGPLGSPRRFLLRPHGGGPSRGFSLGWGDLLVMGGTCQRTYQHCVPEDGPELPAHRGDVSPHLGRRLARNRRGDPRVDGNAPC